ncbi:hypothetical protein M422DRAFT_28779 [Sphaerobolus stellatus SS14]|nr:hypothetical protein M422DRAFT_28779 [Sphaerobolus stellatus SS14]
MFGTIGPELRNRSLEAERYLYKGPKQRVARVMVVYPSNPKKINFMPAQSAC